MSEMIEVTQAYFYKVILILNVHVSAFENHTEWKLNGTLLIAKSTPGYANHYVNGQKQSTIYFVIQDYIKKENNR